MTAATTLYCTSAQCITYFGQGEVVRFADKDGNNAEDSALLTLLIASASYEIESYITAVLPLNPVPEKLTTVCMDIVRYMCYTDKVPDAVKNRYMLALAYLQGIKNGTIILSSLATADQPAQRTAYNTDTRQLTDTLLQVI